MRLAVFVLFTAGFVLFTAGCSVLEPRCCDPANKYCSPSPAVRVLDMVSLRVRTSMGCVSHDCSLEGCASEGCASEVVPASQPATILPNSSRIPEDSSVSTSLYLNRPNSCRGPNATNRWMAAGRPDAKLPGLLTHLFGL